MISRSVEASSRFQTTWANGCHVPKSSLARQPSELTARIARLIAEAERRETAHRTGLDEAIHGDPLP